MKKTINLPKVQPVHLKPIFGMKPGLWLTILYSIVMLFAVFFICFLPGIKNGFKRVTFTSSAYNAAVYIDGNYSGGTPYTVRVPSGVHNIEYKVNGELIDNFEITVSHPVFLTWLFPRKMEVSSNAVLTDKAYKALTKEFFEDLSTYSAILEYSDVHRYPDLFQNYAKCIKTYSNADFNILKKYAVCFITTQEMRADAQKAFDYLELGEVIIPESKKIDFEEALLSNTVVTEAEFAQFTSENSNWSVSNKENLVKQGLVDSFYLEGVGTSPLKAVVNVSYYAAEAYCKWLGKKTGKTCFIPTQQQWTEVCNSNKQSFAKTSIVDQNSYSPSSMIGGVWEMTSSAFVPNGDSQEIQDFLTSLDVSTEIVVKGGSYISKESDIDSSTVGVSSRSLCSDYMGFRVAFND